MTGSVVVTNWTCVVGSADIGSCVVVAYRVCVVGRADMGSGVGAADRLALARCAAVAVCVVVRGSVAMVGSADMSCALVAGCVDAAGCVYVAACVDVTGCVGGAGCIGTAFCDGLTGRLDPAGSALTSGGEGISVSARMRSCPVLSGPVSTMGSLGISGSIGVSSGSLGFIGMACADMTGCVDARAGFVCTCSRAQVRVRGVGVRRLTEPKDLGEGSIEVSDDEVGDTRARRRARSGVGFLGRGMKARLGVRFGAVTRLGLDCFRCSGARGRSSSISCLLKLSRNSASCGSGLTISNFLPCLRRLEWLSGAVWVRRTGLVGSMKTLEGKPRRLARPRLTEFMLCSTRPGRSWPGLGVGRRTS